jgi:hypothetical protein
MASLAGAITFLTLAGTPGVQTWSQVVDEGSGSRPNDGTFTQLSLNATAGAPYGSFSNKTEETSLTKPVTDIYTPILTMAPVSDVDVDVTDIYTPVLTMQGIAYLYRTTSDTYTPVLTMAYTALSKGSSTAKAGTDTYTPVVTMVPQVIRQIDITDTYTPVLTMTATKAVGYSLDVTDTYTPVLGMEQLLDQVIGNVYIVAADTYTPTLTMSAVVGAAGDIDIIDISSRPRGVIHIRAK